MSKGKITQIIGPVVDFQFEAGSLPEQGHSIEFKDAYIPVFQNVSAAPFTDATTIKNNIINQLENPVLWCDTILNLKKEGITDFYEVGPGNVLKGLNRRIFPKSNTFTCDKLENLKSCEVL